jgi:hypothetical protein
MQKVLGVINNLNKLVMRKLGLIMAVLLMGTFANAQDGKMVDPVKKDAKKAEKKMKSASKKASKKVNSAVKKDVRKVKKAVKK